MKKKKIEAVHVIEVSHACGAEVFTALSGCNFLGAPPVSWPLKVTREGPKVRVSRESLVVMFIRNPWSRVIAEILSIQSYASGVFPFLEMKKNIRRFVEDSRKITQSDLRSQLDILKSCRRKGGDRFIGRAEELEKDLGEVKKLLQLARITIPDAPKLERTGERYQDFYDQESREWVAELYADDIAAFGYEFDRIPESPFQGDEIGLALQRGEKARREIRDRGKDLAAKYSGGSKGAWYFRSFHLWRRAFANQAEVKVLEVGSGAGISACLLLEEIFPHLESRVHCVDSLDGGNEGEEVFWKNVEKAKLSERIELYRGSSTEVLAWMIAEEGYWESFDLIVIDGSSLARDVLADACQGFHLVKGGGRMIFGPFGGSGSAHPELAIEAFSQIFGSVVLRKDVGGLVVFEKRQTGDKEEGELRPELRASRKKNEATE